MLGSPKPDITNPDGSSRVQIKGVCVLVGTPFGLWVFMMKQKMAENREFSTSVKFANLVTYSNRQCDILSINPFRFGCGYVLNGMDHDEFYSGIPGSYLSAHNDIHE